MFSDFTLYEFLYLAILFYQAIIIFLVNRKKTSKNIFWLRVANVLVNFPLQFFYYYVISDGLNLVTTTVILPYAAILFSAYISYNKDGIIEENKHQFTIELLLHLGVTLIVFAIFLLHFLEIF